MTRNPLTEPENAAPAQFSQHLPIAKGYKHRSLLLQPPRALFAMCFQILLPPQPFIFSLPLEVSQFKTCHLQMERLSGSPRAYTSQAGGSWGSESISHCGASRELGCSWPAAPPLSPLSTCLIQGCPSVVPNMGVPCVGDPQGMQGVLSPRAFIIGRPSPRNCGAGILWAEVLEG